MIAGKGKNAKAETEQSKRVKDNGGPISWASIISKMRESFLDELTGLQLHTLI